MNVNSNEILLLKGQGDGEDTFEPLLTKNGFGVKHLAVLEFVFINLPILYEKLKNVDKYDGLIFTSPRSVTATKMCLNESKLDEKWQNKSNFVVGQSTFALVKKELGLICNGRDSGNANNLADIIITELHAQSFVFPCGNLKKETLQLRLLEHNIEVDCVTVYETRKNENFVANFKYLTCHYTNMPEYILFFSPSGVQFTAHIFKSLSLDKIKFIAIGPSTEKAIKEENLPLYAVASKPTAAEVLKTILKN